MKISGAATFLGAILATQLLTGAATANQVLVVDASGGPGVLFQGSHSTRISVACWCQVFR